MSEARSEVKRQRPRTRESPERLPWLRYDRIARAVTERLRVRPVPGQPFWVLAVRNPVHHTHYQVCLPDHPAGEARFCSCVDFSRRGIGTCKHVEAATAWLEAHPEVARPSARRQGVSNLWRKIDMARAESAGAGLPLPVSIRAAGRLLFERGPASGPTISKKRDGGKGSVAPAASRSR